MNLAKMIDHTVLKPETSKQQIETLCAEAKQYGFASVCVNPSHVKTAALFLKDTDVKVCTVIGFPLGATTSNVKAYETNEAINNGATEVDMVINVGALKSGDDKLVFNDVIEVVNTAKAKALVKVIIETALLTNEEKVRACELAVEADADYVKTSTGFASGGATVADITLMRKTVGEHIGVKASGGIRDRHTVFNMIEAGATRIGASAGIEIVHGETSDSQY